MIEAVIGLPNQLFYNTGISTYIWILTNRKKQGNLDFSKLNAYIDPAVDRYKALDEIEQDEFKSSLAKFIRAYSFVCGIVRLNDAQLHEFFAYAKCLIQKIPKNNKVIQLHVDDEVSLQYYRVQKIFEGSIMLKESLALYNAMHAGKTKTEEEKLPLSELVEKLNDRFGTDFTEEDMLVVEQFIADMDNNEELKNQARVKTVCLTVSIEIMWVSSSWAQF